MNKDDFYIVNSWMIDELELSGIELQCFAIIWSLSRGEKQMYIAGNSHLVRMTKKTEQTIITTLKKLCEKGLIKKFPVTVNNVERNYYKAISKGAKNILVGGSNNFSGGTKKILAPNIERNIESNNNEKRLSNDNQKKEDISFEDFYKLYPLKKSRKPAETKWNGLSVKDKKAAIDVLPRYVADCISHKRSFKYPATYLNQRTWEDDFTPVEAEEQENNNQPEELPAGLDETTWDKFRAWGEKDIPRIINDISPEDYVKMLGMAHLSKSVMIDILKELNEGEYEGDLLGHYDSLRESPAYWHRIIGGNSHDTETGD